MLVQIIITAVFFVACIAAIVAAVFAVKKHRALEQAKKKYIGKCLKWHGCPVCKTIPPRVRGTLATGKEWHKIFNVTRDENDTAQCRICSTLFVIDPNAIVRDVIF